MKGAASPSLAWLSEHRVALGYSDGPQKRLQDCLCELDRTGQSMGRETKSINVRRSLWKKESPGEGDRDQEREMETRGKRWRWW